MVTLLRSDEGRCAKVGSRCQSLGMRWHHLPISGAKKLCASIPIDGFHACAHSSDLQSLLDLRQIGNVLKAKSDEKEPRRVVIHCAAGQHRTGLTAYLILRDMGMGRDEALAEIRSVRPVTHQEVLKERKPRTWFQNESVKTLVDFAESYRAYRDANA